MAEVSAAVTVPEPIGQEAAYHRHKAAAEALGAGAVKVRGDVLVARENFATGYRAVMELKHQLVESWPAARVAKLGLGLEYADAALFAGTKAEALDVSDGATRAIIASAYDWREKLLAVFDMAGKWTLVPAARVVAIRKGTGAHDAAQDVVDMVALAREYAPALHGKVPYTTVELAEAERVGNAASRATKPGGARERVNPEAKAAAELANRFWTLLVLAHEELRKAGFELWGDKLGDHVPPLQSRVHVSRAPPEAPPTPG